MRNARIQIIKNQAQKNSDLATSAGRQMNLRRSETGVEYCLAPASVTVFQAGGVRMIEYFRMKIEYSIPARPGWGL